MACVNTKAPADAEFAKPKGKGEKGSGKGGKPNSNTLTAGGAEIARLRPADKRLLKPERNLAMANAPRCGKDVFSRGWNAQWVSSRP